VFGTGGRSPVRP